MTYGIYLSAEGAAAQSTRVETIANNLANVDTVGFKRELALLQARYSQAIEDGTSYPGSETEADLGGGVLVRQTKTDFSEGPLKVTKNRNDLAIVGEGFFQVRKGNDTYLTRAGNFQITSNGEVITQQGYSVLGEGGTPLRIDADAGDWHFTEDGAVEQPGNKQYFSIVRPQRGDIPQKQGENLFRISQKPEILAANQRRTAPGFLEASGVKPALEMTSLIEASRLMEANINLMKTQDQLMGSLLSRVLRA